MTRGAWGQNPLEYGGDLYDVAAKCDVNEWTTLEIGPDGDKSSRHWAIDGSWCSEERCGFDNDYCCVNFLHVVCESEAEAYEKLYRIQSGARKLYDR